MLEYRAEGLCRNANRLTGEELARCLQTREVLQSTALAFDTAAACGLRCAGGAPICRLRNVWTTRRRNGQGHCRAEAAWGGRPALC